MIHASTAVTYTVLAYSYNVAAVVTATRLLTALHGLSQLMHVEVCIAAYP